MGVAIGRNAAKGRSGGDGSAESVPQDPLVISGVDADGFVEALSEAITFRTIVLDDGTYDCDAFDALNDMLKRRYPLVHSRLSSETFDGHGLLYTWQGTDSSLDPIVLMAHQDVVPVEAGTEDDWEGPPFAGAVIDGRIYGRGALDCKGALIAIFEALEHLQRTDFVPERTVYVVSGHDGEIGGANGAKVIAAEMLSRGIRPWFVDERIRAGGRR